MRDVTTQLRAVTRFADADSLRHFAPAAISGAASETTTSEKRHAEATSIACRALGRQASSRITFTPKREIGYEIGYEKLVGVWGMGGHSVTNLWLRQQWRKRERRQFQHVGGGLEQILELE
jgi:hypothetical protein